MPRITGWKIGALKHDLASGKSFSECARMYGVSVEGVSKFNARHTADIEELRANARKLLDDLWIADKAKRVASYQDDVDRIQDLLESTNDDRPDDEQHEQEEKPSTGRRSVFGGVPLAELIRTQQAARRAVAEELGDLPQRLKIEGGGEPVRHVLEGVNVEDLT